MNNYSYIYSLIELYLKNENEDKKANLIISKQSDRVILKFNMAFSDAEKTTYDIPMEVINTYIANILNTYKQKELIIDEKYTSKNNSCKYQVKFKNGRKLTLENFTLIEINNLRNMLFEINIQQEEIRVKEENNEVLMNYKPRLQETGFISFKSIFMIALIFSDIFMLSLWIFKLIMK